MTIGGKSQLQALEGLMNTRSETTPITTEEHRCRIAKAQRLMSEMNIDALYLTAGTSLYYFTGVSLGMNERLIGAIFPEEGDPIYISPTFEEPVLRGYITIGDDVRVWEEDEDPYACVRSVLADLSALSGRIAVEEKTPYFAVRGLAGCAPMASLVDATPITAGCRMQKSAAEIMLMQHAKNITLDVHRRTSQIMYEGITTTQIAAFINDAHKIAGSDNGSTFCIVSFGENTAYPHAPNVEQSLKWGDLILIDTGCTFHGYHSDITRTYIFGEPSAKQNKIWAIEKEAQQAAFDAAQIGRPCASIDAAARAVLERYGLGPDYKTPGLPHRTGHGIGLDIHEWPYLVRGDLTPLAQGMCFSNEPMICLYGEFGVRLEDHFYMTGDGPRWFTHPSHAIDDPFGERK